MTLAKSVLAAILLAAIWTRLAYSRGFPQVPYPSVSTSTSHSPALFSLSPCPAPRLVPRHASKNLPSRPRAAESPPPRCWPVLHDTNPHHPCYSSQIVSPHTFRRVLLSRAHDTVFGPISYLMITACSTSPRLGHWQRARQTAKCCFAAPYYY
ncbi:hypothetical protein EDB89DRAFT_2000426 [Lactarius sanguifluus]|nr:hypothetical protein EDB89DRAFT_2000426 [Lactarius sanguifluus]